MAHPNCDVTLWMGDGWQAMAGCGGRPGHGLAGLVKKYMLEPHWDEEFIRNAFQQCGESVAKVKLIMNKYHGGLAGYCFVEFSDQDNAHRAMLRLNGKVVPGSSPSRRFKLNHASYGKEHLMVPEYSLFVGDLSEDVDDLALYSVFSKRYKSCRGAKVVLDQNGQSRGYGFVRFTEETDQQSALYDKHKYPTLGSKPLRVSLATPKRPGGNQTSGYSQYYQQQQQQQYQGYNQGYNYNYNYNYHSQYPGYSGWGDYNNYNYYNYQNQGYGQDYPGYQQSSEGDNQEDEPLEDPNLDIDVDKLNSEFISQSEELYTALEGSRWHPLDNVMSTVTATVLS